MNTKLQGMKTELKKQAIELKITKKELKECQRSTPHEAYKIQWLKTKKHSEYRHKHIAYCLSRGTPYDKIEVPKKGNEPNWTTIEKFKEEYSYA